MARDKALQTNIDNSDPVNYPNARIKNNTGAGDGTPVNEQVYGDIHETFAKLMRRALLSYNHLPENETKGYQYIQALEFLATDNDKIKTMYALGSTGKVGTTINLDRLRTDESFIMLSSMDITTETILSRGTGGGTATGLQLAIAFKGTAIKSGDYVRFVRTGGGCDLVRLADGDTFNLMAEALNYLTAASQAEENAGAINTKATTPLTNFTAFAERVIGSASAPFLASAGNNGLMSAADFTLLQSLTNPENNYGTFGPFDVNFGSVNDLYGISGDVGEAKIVQRTGSGQVVRVTLNNAMLTSDYEPRINVQSNGNMSLDNRVFLPVFKIIDATTFDVIFEESSGGTHSITIHVSTIQR